MISRRLRRLSLTTQLTAWYVGLLTFLLLALGMALYAATSRLSSAAALGEASIEAHALREMVQTRVSQGEPLGDAATTAIGARRMQGNLIQITDATGNVVAEAAGAIPKLETAPGVAEGVRSGPTDEWLGVVEQNQSGALAVSLVRLTDPRSGAAVGVLEVGVALAESERIVQTLLVIVGIGFGAVLFVAAVVGPRLTRLGLLPLRTIAQVSRELANGDLSARAPTPEIDDEVGELARAFNDMARQLETNFETQRAFVADASHELRTPLNALGGLIDVLVRVIEAQPDEARRLAGHMRREVDRMAALVDDLLVLARLEAQGPVAFEMQAVDLRSVARDVYEQARALPVARGRDLVLHVDAQPASARGEPRRLHQMLLNLTINALQHAPEGGHVRLQVDRCEASLRVEVQDNGPGIPAEQLPRVFDRFYRTDTARARADGGTGLGLAIARAIAEAHDGRIVVSNSAEGGAVFSVTLPGVN